MNINVKNATCKVAAVFFSVSMCQGKRHGVTFILHGKTWDYHILMSRQHTLTRLAKDDRQSVFE